MIRAVVKIGGSLAKAGALPDLCRVLAPLALDHPLLLVPGGGGFADQVRRSASELPLSDHAAHWMAVLAMDQMGLLLADLIPGGLAVTGLDQADKAARDGRCPVLLPHGLLREHDPLPHSWDVTSDSIAAWVAGQSGAELLVLAKDVDGLWRGGHGLETDAGPLPEMGLDELEDCGGVDAHLAGLLRQGGPACWVLNGRRPERLVQLLETGRTLGTRLAGR